MTEVANPHISRPQSMVMVRIGGEDFPMVSVPTCATCQSNHRRFIENELLRGRAYSAIARQAATMQGHGHLGVPSRDSIGNHVRAGHLPQPAFERRKIIENRAKSLGMQIEGEDNLVDYMTVNEMVIQRGMERLTSGEIEPGIGDLLQAIRNQHSFESLSEKGFDVEAFEQAMFVYFSTAQQHMSPQQFESMMADLKKDPILRALNQKAQKDSGQGEEDLDGEVLSETVHQG